MKRTPNGPLAARWRKRKFDQLRRYQIPEDLLPGSLTHKTVRCGKPTCRCVHGAGHSVWTLTFMSDGKKRVIAIPPAMVEDVQRRVRAGHVFQEAVRDVLTSNAELLHLQHQQEKKLHRRKPE